MSEERREHASQCCVDCCQTNVYGFEKLSPYYIFEQGMRQPGPLFAMIRVSLREFT